MARSRSSSSTRGRRRKVGRPRKHPPKDEIEEQEEVIRKPARGRRRKRPLPETTFVEASASSPPPSPPPNDTILSHFVRVAPLFPPPIQSFISAKDDNDDDDNGDAVIRQGLASDPSTRLAFGRGLGVMPPPPKPQWTPLKHDDFYYPQDYGKDGLKEDAMPVSRLCSCMALSEPYLLAVGDTAGFVLLYTLQGMALPLKVLNTSASQREYTSLAHQSLKSTKYGFRVPDIKLTKAIASQQPNAIEAIAVMSETKMVVVSTKMEVELLDANANTIVWTKTMEETWQGGPAVKLDLNLSNQVLASFWFGNNGTASTKAESSTPLLLLHKAHNDAAVETNIVIPHDDDNDDKGQLKLGPKCAAMWDRSDENRIVMVSLVLQDGQVPNQQVLLLEKESYKIISSALNPLKIMGSKTISTEALSQSVQGTYTLVASTRGIRLFETATLDLLCVYGETLSLHGHGIVWQDCFLIPRTDEPCERDDELQYRDEQKKPKQHENDDSVLNALVVGVPHAFRQPIELKSTLHFWDAQAGGKHAAFTIVGPTTDCGMVKVLHHEKANRLLVSTQQGDCVELTCSLQSAWPGIMYPPGYHVVDDNLVYIEDEDEVDVVIDVAEPKQEPPQQQQEEEEVDPEWQAQVVADADLAEAVRRSVLDQKRAEAEAKRAENEEHVNVVDLDETTDQDVLNLACKPEPFLMQQVDDGVEEEGATELVPKEASFVQCFLNALPQTHVQEQKRTPEEVEGAAQPSAPLAARVPRGKRSRTANLEAMIKASIRPKLRSFMFSRQEWNDGSGSCLTDTQSISSAVVVARRSSSTLTEATSLDISLTTSNTSELNGTKGEQGLRDSLNGKSTTENGDNGSRSFMDQCKPQKTFASVNTNKRGALRCDACLGRMVIHACGKRELPVDFEAIARAEKEKLEKEKAEKQRVRTEKRRLADQKRREAKRRKKQEEEERRKLEEMQRLQEEKAMQEEESRRNEDHHMKERRRAEMMQRLMAAQQQESSAVYQSNNVVQAHERAASLPQQPQGSWESTNAYRPADVDYHAKERRRAEIIERLNAMQKDEAAAVPKSQSVAPLRNVAAEPGKNIIQPQQQQGAWISNNAAYEDVADKRKEALEALTSLANGFVGSSPRPNNSLKSPQPQIPENDRNGTAIASSAAYPSNPPHESHHAHVKSTGPTSSVGTEQPSGHVNRGAAQVSDQQQAASSCGPLPAPPPMVSHAFALGFSGQSATMRNYAQADGNTTPATTPSQSMEARTPHGFSPVLSSNGVRPGWSSSTSPYQTDPTAFREHVRQGLQGLTTPLESHNYAAPQPAHQVDVSKLPASTSFPPTNGGRTSENSFVNNNQGVGEKPPVQASNMTAVDGAAVHEHARIHETLSSSVLQGVAVTNEVGKARESENH